MYQTKCITLRKIVVSTCDFPFMSDDLNLKSLCNIIHLNNFKAFEGSGRQQQYFSTKPMNIFSLSYLYLPKLFVKV